MTADEPERRDPVEVELKYRVTELAAARATARRRRVGPFAVTGGRARSTQLEDRYVDTADGALAGPVSRCACASPATRRSSRSSRWRGPTARAASVRREELEGPADRVAAPVDWPAVRRAGAGPRACRRRAARRARDRPPAPSQAAAQVGRDPGRAEPRRGRCREPRPHRRPVRRARGRAPQGRRGRSSRRSAAVLDAEPDAACARARASSRRRWRAVGRGPTGRDAASGAADAPRRARSPSRPRAPRPRAGARRRRPRLVVGKTPGVTRRRPRRRGRPQGHALPPRADARPRGRASAPASTPRTSTRCASRPAGSEPRGGSSARRSGRAGRSATATACARRRGGLARCATSTSSSRRPTPIGRTCPSRSSARSSRCSAPGGSTATMRGCCSLRELDSPAYRRWLDDYVDFVRTEGVGGPAGRPGRAAPRPRHRAVADLGRLRGGARLRVGPALGRRRRRSTSCGSPASGCATRWSSSGRRSAPKRRR